MSQKGALKRPQGMLYNLHIPHLHSNFLTFCCKQPDWADRHVMSVLREELNVKAIWEAQSWGTHYVASFYRLPSEMTKFKVRKGRFHLHSSYSETMSICDCVQGTNCTCILSPGSGWRSPSGPCWGRFRRRTGDPHRTPWNALFHQWFPSYPAVQVKPRSVISSDK